MPNSPRLDRSKASYTTWRKELDYWRKHTSGPWKDQASSVYFSLGFGSPKRDLFRDGPEGMRENFDEFPAALDEEFAIGVSQQMLALRRVHEWLALNVNLFCVFTDDHPSSTKRERTLAHPISRQVRQQYPLQPQKQILCFSRKRPTSNGNKMFMPYAFLWYMFRPTEAPLTQNF